MKSFPSKATLGDTASAPVDARRRHALGGDREMPVALVAKGDEVVLAVEGHGDDARRIEVGRGEGCPPVAWRDEDGRVLDGRPAGRHMDAEDAVERPVGKRVL
jgi:hypothetical protein